jgi:L-histidine Nalpha-methyltransferase
MKVRGQTIQFGIAAVVKKGLLSDRKEFPYWLTLDNLGLEIREEIRRLPEFYPAVSRAEIDTLYSTAIALNFKQESKRWNFLDWMDDTPGDASSLLEAFVKNGMSIIYYPVASSAEIAVHNRNLIKSHVPSIVETAAVGEVSELIESLQHDRSPSLFFLNSAESVDINDLAVLLRALSLTMGKKDRVMILFDLMKSPAVIEKACHDYKGVNGLLHKNALTRINREMNANFNPRQFEYWPIYDAVTGTCRRYLVSTCEQVVKFSQENFEVVFKPWETISMGLSQKYSEEMIDDLLQMAGLRLEKMIFDQRKYEALCILKSI